jgi:maestro heat-like repeat-containing protein family member 1
MRGIFEYMLPYLRGNYAPQRVVTSAVFSAFVNNCKDDRELLQKLVNSLLSSVVDPNVKLVTLKGLSNVVANGAEQTNRYISCCVVPG